jgi:ubiquinone/menaquinone biosynthesis C-methylase UbiE
MANQQNQQKVINCYNSTAGEYATNLFDELSKKPFDRLLLKQFASENKTKGKMIDLGCGSGQTTKFLAENGVKDIAGTDLSPGMIRKAKQLNPNLRFQAADMLKLDFPDQYFAAAIAFYAIVHFNDDQLKTAFTEVNRILISGGQFLLSFHIGDEIFHRDELFGVPVDIDFYFFKTEKIVELLKEANFKIVDAIEHYPYENWETSEQTCLFVG